MHHYTYKIQFKNGPWYIGKRSSKLPPLEDTSYNGSGVILGNFIKKFPEDFQKIILGVYLTDQEAYEAEKQLIGDKWITESYRSGKGNCLNISEGGKGFQCGEGHFTKSRHPMLGKKQSEESKQKNREAHIGKSYYAGNVLYRGKLYIPYRHPDIMNRDNARKVWLLAAQIYNIWILNTEITPISIARALGEFNTSKIKPYYTIVNRIRTGWNPNSDPDWLEWFNTLERGTP